LAGASPQIIFQGGIVKRSQDDYHNGFQQQTPLFAEESRHSPEHLAPPRIRPLFRLNGIVQYLTCRRRNRTAVTTRHRALTEPATNEESEEK
jgi:hypothetical protein